MKKQVLFTAFMASVALPTMASDFYMIADLGQSKLDFDHEDGGYSAGDNTTFSLGGGYKLNKIFALEAVYRDLGDFNQRTSADYPDGSYQRFSSDTSLTSFQASVLAQFSVTETIDLYGRVGVGSLKSKSHYELDAVMSGYDFSSSGSSSDSKTKMVLGVGFKYALSQEFAVRVEYNQYDKWEEATISSSTIGLTYQF